MFTIPEAICHAKHNNSLGVNSSSTFSSSSPQLMDCRLTLFNVLSLIYLLLMLLLLLWKIKSEGSGAQQNSQSILSENRFCISLTLFCACLTFVRASRRYAQYKVNTYFNLILKCLGIHKIFHYSDLFTFSTQL